MVFLVLESGGFQRVGVQKMGCVCVCGKSGGSPVVRRRLLILVGQQQLGGGSRWQGDGRGHDTKLMVCCGGI